MKLYLSSYKFGNETDKLKQLVPVNNRIGHINNSRDWVGRDAEIAAKHQNEEIEVLNKLGFQAEALDLKDYFGKTEALKSKLENLGAVWVSGGNAFVLRQAMKLSGFDVLFEDLVNRDDFLYGGYSAGICILSDTLKPIENVDEPNNFPYNGIEKAIYKGLGFFNYSLMPHYRSDHFESEMIEKEVERCIRNKWLFKALKDGEVIVIE